MKSPCVKLPAPSQLLATIDRSSALTCRSKFASPGIASWSTPIALRSNPPFENGVVNASLIRFPKPSRVPSDGSTDPIASITRTCVTSYTFSPAAAPGSDSRSLRSNGVPVSIALLPARLCTSVGSIDPNVPTCVVVGVNDTDGKRKKFTPSELTSTCANSANSPPVDASINAFSNTAKSAPGPSPIGVANESVIRPPSPRLTVSNTSPGSPSVLSPVPNDAGGLDSTLASCGPRTRSVYPVAQA